MPFLPVHSDTCVLTSSFLWVLEIHLIWKNDTHVFIGSHILKQTTSHLCWCQLTYDLLKNLFQREKKEASGNKVVSIVYI